MKKAPCNKVVIAFGNRLYGVHSIGVMKGLAVAISRPTVKVHRNPHYLMCYIWNVYGFSARKITTFLQIKAVSPKNNE